MKSHELRIGNYVAPKRAIEILAAFENNNHYLVAHNAWVPLQALSSNEIVLFEQEIDGRKFQQQVNIQRFKPIPLKDEVLLRCGFKSNFEGIYDLDHEVAGMAKAYEYRLESDILPRPLICHPYKGWYVYIDGCEQLTTKADSLHKLQNLYFTMTGEELRVDFKTWMSPQPTMNSSVGKKK